MFDYLINKYNPTPNLIPEEELQQDFLYVNYSEAPYLTLPTCLEDFRSLHKKKFWYNLKRSVRLYEDNFGKLHFKIVKDQENLEYFLEQVYELFNQRWENEYTSATWKKKEGFKEYKQAMIDLASKGKAFLAVLHDDNKKLLSYGFCLDQNSTIYFYQHTTTIEPTYRTFSLGKVLINNLLQYAITEKYDKFDFMAGISPYKHEWTKESQKIYRLIGKKSITNYIKFLLVKVRYFLQFNPYSRKALKLIWTNMERYFARR